jgi:hypothetical protein
MENLNIIEILLISGQKKAMQKRGGVMVFNATFYTISVISWQSSLLVEERGVPEENQTASH